MNDISVTFADADFGDEFQEKVIQALVLDRRWAEQMVEIIRPEYFELHYLQICATKYFEYYNEHKAFPTHGILLTTVRRHLKDEPDEAIKRDALRFFQRMKTKPELNDLPYIQKESLAFCKKQAMAEALDKSVDLIESDRYEEVLAVMKTALMAGQEATLGHDFNEEREARWETEFRHPVPVGIPQLDAKEVFEGGAGKGELCVIAASKGVGKSHWLVHVASVALEHGLNVVYYTLELRDLLVGLRHDSWLCNINSKLIREKKEEVARKYQEFDSDPSKKIGRLIIKQYPSGQATCNTIRAHLQRLTLKKDFKPDLIVVDYADCMRATEKFDTNQTRFELKRIYEELRNIAIEVDVPLWTASQINKEGSKDDIATIEHLAEAFGKADVADIILTIACKQKEKANGYATLFIAKSRAGADGLCFPIHIDRGTSRFRIASEDEMPKEVNDEEEAKKKARRAAHRMEQKRLKEMGGDPVKVVPPAVH
jgi:replicative DNA helicase